MSAAAALDPSAVDEGPSFEPALPPTLVEAVRARLETAQRREREAVRRLDEAIRRCEETHVDASRRLAAFDALLASTRAVLRQRGFPVAAMSPSAECEPR